MDINVHTDELGTIQVANNNLRQCIEFDIPNYDIMAQLSVDEARELANALTKGIDEYDNLRQDN